MREPRVVLVDARRERLEPDGLRRFMRGLAVTAHRPYVSRSYRYPFALAAWHDAPVGVDLEREDAFDADFAASICTQAELLRLGDGRDRGRFLTSVWAGKEALAKAFGDPLAYLPRRLESPEIWPEATAGRWHARRLGVPPDHCGWLCWRDP